MAVKAEGKIRYRLTLIRSRNVHIQRESVSRLVIIAASAVGSVITVNMADGKVMTAGTIYVGRRCF